MGFVYICLLFVLGANAVFDNTKLRARPVGVDPDFDCQARSLAYEYALQIQPARAPLQSVFDALQLTSLCNVTFPSAKGAVYTAPYFDTPKDTAGTFYVDTNRGSDSNSGSISAPFKTIPRALVATRAAGEGSSIILRAGTFFINETINLGPQDSGLTIVNYPEEFVEINGGIPIQPNWQQYNNQKDIQIYNSTNAVYGEAVFKADTPTIKYLGMVNTAAQCLAACAAYGSNCHAFTFHEPTLTNGWAQLCYGRTDYIFSSTFEDQITSGQIIYNNVYVADLSGQGIKKITGLQLGNTRCIRARFPNADPEVAIFPDGWISETDTWGAPVGNTTAVTFTIPSPQRTDMTMFQQYTIGKGGNCNNFFPNESFWCSAERSGGGADIYHVPSSVTFLPTTFLGRKWNNPIGAIVHAWQISHWENWMFEVDSYNADSQTIGWTKGGFQGARGCLCTGASPHNYGAQWYVDGVFEELDSPNEFFFDAAAQKLYYFYNATGAPPSTGFVATNLEVLINATGTQTNPIKNLVIRGIQFQNAAYTYMEPHGVPSGGDWALQRTAAVFFEGTENTTVDSCLFQRLDGNALMLSGYHRYATISNSEFVWIGDTAMAAWGYTNEMDGTTGTQPRHTTVVGNIVHELGHYTKQASAWFQAKTCQTLIKNNIFFNGPRAGINFNDGFGGANEITENLLFNQCRESSDHGPFNSWDREPFLTEVLNGTAQLTPAYNDIHSNFFLCNYGSSMCVDNDDGSSYYNIHNNFEVYGGHKSDFGGHNKFTYNSVVAFAMDYSQGVCGSMDKGVAGFVDGFYNNTCIQTSAIPYLNLPCDPSSCDPKTLPISHDNKVYNNKATVTVNVNGKVYSESAWQKMGEDSGTTAYPLPTNEQIIQWGKQILGMP